MTRPFKRQLLLLIVPISVPAVVNAQTFTGFMKRTTISGAIRAYNFNKFFGAPTIPNARAFALGALVNLKTAPFLTGFRVGASFYSANSLGLNSLSHPAITDPTLMGYNSSLNAFGQAYIQYSKTHIGEVRVGDQSINTPWMNSSDSRMIPATYQAVQIAITALPAVTLYFLREFRWKSKTSSAFYRDNLYYQPASAGTSWGGVGGLPPNAPTTSGTLAAGATWHLQNTLNATSWYYDFYGFTHLYYASAAYTVPGHSLITPLLGVQYARETEASGLLNNVRINTQAGRGVDATAYGAITGLNTPDGQITMSYNSLAQHQGSIGGGALISPYTAGYTSDPLYTTSMLRGLVELGPGHAWKIRYTVPVVRRKWYVTTAYARYYTYYYGTAEDTYLDVSYAPGRRWRGLSIRDRVEMARGGHGLTPGNRYFVYNRIMLQYTF